MDKTVLELMSNVKAVDLMYAIFLILALFVLYLTQKQKISKHLDKWRESENQEEDFHALVYELKETVNELRKEVKDNREEINEVLTDQSEKIENLKEITLAIQEKNSETKRAEIKEKIERIYRECSPELVCTEMQLESLKDLIDQYEKHGGINSFVHTKVLPEMYSWQVIDKVTKNTSKD